MEKKEIDLLNVNAAQQILTRSKSTVETQVKGAKYFES